MSPHGGDGYITRSRNGPAAPSVHSNSHTSTSSSIDPFPTLTTSQHRRLDRIINALDRDATSWAEFKQKKEELEGVNSEEDEEDNDIFPISLKLVFQQGVTWKDKWAGVQQKHDQTERRQSQITVGVSHSRRKSGRESDGLDVLRARMDRVKLYDSDITPRRDTSSPTQPRTSIPPTRPRSTPAALHSQPSSSSHRPPASNSTRSFLVHRTEPGHSSSDDYAGVPSLQDLALARRRRRESETRESAPPLQSTPARPAREIRGGQTEQRPVSPIFQDILPPPSQPPAQSTPPPRSKHPLLEKRLAELGLATPGSTGPTTQTPTPISSEPPRQSSPSRLRPSATTIVPQPQPRDLSSLEAEADRFRQLRLTSSHFDAWRNLTSFQMSRTQAVDHARETWVARCAIQDWAGKAARMALLKEREEEWIRTKEEKGRKMEKGVKAHAWMRWTATFLKRQDAKRQEEIRERKEVREGELRTAKGEVVRRRNEGLARRAIEQWRLMTLRSLAFRFRLRYLPLGPLRRWRRALTLKQSHVATLESVAEEVWTGSEQNRVGEAFRIWRKKMRLNIAEKVVEERSNDVHQHNTLSVWIGRTQKAIHIHRLEDTAVRFDHRRLVSTSLATWRTRRSRLETLAQQADSLSSDFSLRLLRTSLKTWSLATTASKFYQGRTEAFATRCLSSWVERLDHIQIELEGRALEVLQEKNKQLRSVTFDAWRSSVQHRNRLELAAVAVSRKNTLTRSLATWRKRREGVELDGRKADVVRQFFAQRGAWRIWVDKIQERKQRRWLEARIRLRKKEALEFWLARTKRSIDDKKLIALVEQKNRKRTLIERLAVWKEQVIVRKELERGSTILYESRLVESALKRWVTSTVNFSAKVAQADNFRSIKQEELRDSTFHSWLLSTRQSLELKKRLEARLEQRRTTSLENTFERWRERRLRKFEQQVKARVDRGTRGAVLERWQAETTMLTALRVYRNNLLNRKFSLWKRWTPCGELKAKGVEHDTRILIGCTIQRWSLKTSYRQAFRNASGRLSAPRSIPSPSSHSTSHQQTSSPSSPSIRNAPLSESSLVSPPPVDSPSPAPSHSNVGSRSPLTRAPSLRRRGSSNSSTLVAVPRPRLFAEYVPPTPPSRRRRSSVVSLGARSAPAPLELETEHSDSEAEVTGRPIARSEGGAKDVRKGYEALRERLRAAASARRI